MNNFHIRVIFSCFVGFFIAAGLCNIAFPSIMHQHHEGLTQELAVDEGAQFYKKSKSKKADSTNVLEQLNAHHLAWYYLTNGQGIPLQSTKSFAPDFKVFPEYSHSITWRNQLYYEAVAPVNKKANLHVGFYSGPPLGLANDFLTETVPLTIVCFLLLLYIMICGLVYVLSVTIPTHKLSMFYQRKDSASGITSGALQTPGAVTEIRALRKLIERKDKLVAEQQSQLDERDAKIKKMNRRYEEDLGNANKERSALYLKDMESRFIDQLRHALDDKTRLDDLANTLLASLNAEFPQSSDLILFFSNNNNNESVLISHIGFNNNPAEIYRELSGKRALPYDANLETCIALEPTNITDRCLREIAELTSSKQVLFVPMRFQNRNLAYMVIFFRGQAQTLDHIQRVLNRSAQVAAKALYHITIYEELVETSRTDALTGYPNKNYLSHLIPQLLNRTEGVGTSTRKFALILVEGHDIAAINEKFGRQTGDLVIKELGKRIHDFLRQRHQESVSSFGDYLIRYGSAQFLIILRALDSKKASIFAQRLRQVIEGQDWPGGIGKWVTAIGITSSPDDSIDAEELIINVETALSYARGLSERERIAGINQVPMAFRSNKSSYNLGGSLDIFDPAALLQSLSMSRKSGVLTVTNSDGKVFWCFVENGKPTKTRMGKFGGTPALLEFLVLFDSGDFNFSDLSGIDAPTLREIQQLGSPFTITNSLERDLMDGALARDHYASAQNLIKQTDLFVWPHPNTKHENAFAFMQNLKDPPSPEEERVMREILRIANGKISLKDIFARMETTPSHCLWRGAALLVENQLIDLKKLATSTPRTF